MKTTIETVNAEDNPSVEYLLDILRTDGIFILENYYSKEKIDVLNEEFDKVFKEHEDAIDILDKEDCSKDQRIFWSNQYSQPIDDIFANDPLLVNIATSYAGRSPNLNTLINYLEYSDTEVRNSGAGWHRDNHHCQFKTMLYLSDVTKDNGNFQWITNSSRRHIGYPKPRTESYNTRYHEEVIEEILKHPLCELIDVTGKPGTVICADTTYVHRGNIIKSGSRRAMTQYYF